MALQLRIKPLMPPPFAVTVFRILVTLLLFTLLLRLVDFDQLVQVLETADLGLILGSFVILLLRLPFMGWRWHLILNHQGYQLSTAYLTKVTVVSVFFSLFLPTGSGGDIVRGIYLARGNIEPRATVTSIVFERFVGLFTLLAIAAPSAGILAFWYPKYRGFALTIFALVGCTALGLLVLNRLSGWLTPLGTGGRPLGRFIDNIRLGLQEMIELARQCTLITQVVVLTLLFQAVGIYSVYLLGLSLQADLDLVFYVVLVPIVWLAMMLPISIGGLGVREGAFVLLFSQVGMSGELALALSLLVLALTVAQSLLGGIVFLLDRTGSAPDRVVSRND